MALIEQYVIGFPAAVPGDFKLSTILHGGIHEM